MRYIFQYHLASLHGRTEFLQIVSNIFEHLDVKRLDVYDLNYRSNYFIRVFNLYKIFNLYAVYAMYFTSIIYRAKLYA